jgi:hypothetical protein
LVAVAILLYRVQRLAPEQPEDDRVLEDAGLGVDELMSGAERGYTDGGATGLSHPGVDVSNRYWKGTAPLPAG